MRRLCVLVSSALALAGLAVGGCGGEEDLTSGLSAAEILGRSRQAASAVRFYHPEITLTLEMSTEPGSEGLPALAGGPVTIVAEGPVRRPVTEEGPAFSFDITATIPGLALDGNITKTADGIYLSVAGQDFTLGLPPEQAAAVRIPPEPALFVDSPQEVGREEIDGVQTVHIAGQVNTDAVVDYLLGVLSGAPDLLGEREPPDDAAAERIRTQVRDAVRESRSEVWIGTKDLLPHRVAAFLALEGTVDLFPGVRSATLEVRADVGGFDEEAEIVAPANPKPFDPQSLPGLGQ